MPSSRPIPFGRPAKSGLVNGHQWTQLYRVTPCHRIKPDTYTFSPHAWRAAYGSSTITPCRFHDQWLVSPQHRRQISKPPFHMLLLRTNRHRQLPSSTTVRVLPAVFNRRHAENSKGLPIHHPPHRKPIIDINNDNINQTSYGCKPSPIKAHHTSPGWTPLPC